MKIRDYLTEKDEYNWKRYESMLKSHDWFYERNSDHTAYEKGRNTKNNINHMHNVLSMEDKKKAYDLWNKYAPKFFKIKGM